MREIKIDKRLTQRSSATDRYFSDVNKNGKLSTDEEFEVATRAAAGDEQAIDRLVCANLRFVISVAKQYSSSPDMLPELIAQGNIGLIDAARTFDPTRGFKFISYAVWHIRKEILNYFNCLSKTVRLPMHVTRDLNRIKAAELNVINRLHREATEDEIIEEMATLGYTIASNQVKLVKEVSSKTVALEPTDMELDYAPIQWIDSGEAANSRAESSDFEIVKNMVFSSLSPVERNIVDLRMGMTTGDPQSFLAIGSIYNRSGEWARSVYTKAMRKAKTRAKKIGWTPEKILNC
jgi:RNA polymerase primary sigma factor